MLLHGNQVSGKILSLLYIEQTSRKWNCETYNPELTKGNNQIPKLQPNSLNIISRKQRLSLDTAIADADLRFGNTITQTESLASANLVGTAGTATGDLGILNPGIGYTPSSGQLTYSGVNLVTITGNGSGATADILLVMV
ncbi:MAG: hypothetical protein CM15mV12_0400 [uncultured marine virus]|nr:MAG: hypothetical protein CM15mV12_0400 [uncultured marine virus]